MRLHAFLFLCAAACVGAAQSIPNDPHLTVRERAVTLLSAPTIRQELSLTDKQSGSVETLFRDLEAKVKAIFTVQDAKDSDALKAEKESAAKLFAVLEPTQKRRLEELTFQRLGIRTLGDKEVAQQLGISDEHRDAIAEMFKKLDTRTEDIDAEIGDLLAGFKIPEDPAEKVKAEAQRQRIIDGFELEKKAVAKDSKSAEIAAEKLLSEAERKRWQAAQGTKFKFYG